MPVEEWSEAISAGLGRAEARGYERGTPGLQEGQRKEAMAFVRSVITNPSTAAHPLTDETVSLLADVVYTAMAGGTRVDELKQLQQGLCGWGVPD